MAYDNTNSGALFKNDKKESEKHPDYRGSINVDGVDYWISAWLKTSQQGTKFMSLSVSPKEQANYAPAPAPARKPSSDAARSRYPAERQAPQRDEFDDGSSIPF
jgi:uncharacterized protein (DUF736 family)